MLKLLFLLLTITHLNSQIITEFKAAPSNGEPEWIELFNNSSDHIDLSNYMICDAKSCKNLNGTIPPNYFLIISDNNPYLINNYPIPDECIFIDLKLPSLNNTSDEIKLLIDEENLVDSLSYDLNDFSKDFSIERIDFDELATNDNLINSQNEFGATPGQFNSVKAKQYDLSIEDYTENQNSYELKISNKGKKAINDFELVIMLNDSLIFEEDFISIGTKENLVFSIDKSTLKSNLKGFNQLLIFTNFDKDEENNNDTLLIDFQEQINYGDLRFNEVMFDVDEARAEYVEIRNDSNFPINLKNIHFYDKANFNNSKEEVISNNEIINPGELFLLASSESIFSQYSTLDSSKVFLFDNTTLNNTEDIVYLKDEYGIIDSLNYSSSMHSNILINVKNLALERIKSGQGHELNWTSSASADGGTPLYPNSFSNNQNKIGINAEPRTFSPKMNKNSKKCEIIYNLPYVSSKVDITVFDENGRFIKRIVEGKYSASTGVEFWDGKAENDRYVRTGAYIILLEAFDQETNRIYKDKILVAIAF